MSLKKLNPIWWFKNDDDPKVPADLWPGQPQWLRSLKWHLRNPLHNFTFYVIGIADRRIMVIGDYPGDVFAPAGWKRHKVYPLKQNSDHPVIDGWGRPFISYYGKVKFYLGWRERGNFGIKLTGNQ